MYLLYLPICLCPAYPSVSYNPPHLFYLYSYLSSAVYLTFIIHTIFPMLQVWLVLEYCCLGHLGQFAYRTPLTILQKLGLMKQCMDGLNHLHQLQFIHRDIKPENLLVTGRKDKPVIKVADFGVSQFIRQDSNISYDFQTSYEN